MSVKFIITKSAKKDLKSLLNSVSKRIEDKVSYFFEQENPLVFSTPLKGYKDLNLIV